jgi:hypothetical protein
MPNRPPLLPRSSLCVAALALCWGHSVLAQEGTGPNQVLVASAVQATLAVHQAGLANALSYRRLARPALARLSFGPTFEVATFDHWTAFGIFADLAIWPLPHSELSVSPGVKVINRDAPLRNETHFALRMTAGQELAFPPFTVMPRIGADFSAGTVTLMLGVGLGFRFTF